LLFCPGKPRDSNYSVLEKKTFMLRICPTKQWVKCI
jgi:hypothetical protein